MIRIGQKRPRGVKGVTNPHFRDYKNIDVTSGSMNKLMDPFTGEIAYAKTLSPLKGDTHPVTAFDGLVFNNFELYWQANKVYPQLGHAIQRDGEWVLTDKFFQWRKKWAKETKGKRRLVDKSTGLPAFGYYGGRQLSYVESRKYYLRKYCQVIKNLPAFHVLVNMVRAGQPVMILDGDGPPLQNYPEGHEVTWEFIDKMYKDPRFPFGHGYIVAAMIKAAVDC